MKFWSHIINPVNSTNIKNPHIIVRKSEPKKTVTTHQTPQNFSNRWDWENEGDAPEIGARTGGSEIREEEMTWSQPDQLRCVENASNRSEIQSEICKWREKRLRRAKILEVMKQTEVSVLLLGKITRNFHCSFLLLLYVFWVLPRTC